MRIHSSHKRVNSFIQRTEKLCENAAFLSLLSIRLDRSNRTTLGRSLFSGNEVRIARVGSVD